MRILVGALWLILFLVLFAFALNNTAVTELRLFAGMVWQAPLVALLLIFFAAGVAFGFLAMLPPWFRLRLELRRMRRAQASQQATVAPTTTAPSETESIHTLASSARITT